MGGLGSGNRYRWDKKTVVEDCLSIDANRWTCEGILKVGVHHRGRWSWTYSNGKGFALNYLVDGQDPDHASLHLTYSWTWGNTEKPESADYTVRLTTTRPYLGGLRWWFICPLIVNGEACNRRVAKLYLPGSARYFGCRHCHRLTYESVQKHDYRCAHLKQKTQTI